MLKKIRPVYRYFFITLLTAAMVLNLFYAFNYAHTERELLRREHRMSLGQTVYYFDRYMHEIEDISNSIAISSKVQQLFKTAANRGAISYYDYRDCVEYLSEFTLSISKIYRIDLYVKRNSTLITSNEGVCYRMEQDDEGERRCAEYIRALPETSEWTRSYREQLPPTIKKYRETEILTLQRPVYSIYNGKVEGVLFMQVLVSDLKSLIDFEAAESMTTVRVGDGEMLISDPRLLSTEGLRSVAERSEYSGLSFANYYQDPPVSRFMGRIILVALLLVLLFGAIFILLVRISEKRMFYPVNTLLNGFSELKRGDLSYRLEEKRSDLFGVIFCHFNEMAEKLETLMHDLGRERIQRNEFKYQLLQMQIKPHFLYNLFNNMVWLAAQRDYEGLERLVIATAGYYRTALNHGNRDITLEENQKQLEYYSEIQRLRFREEFELEFDFSEDVLGCRIPNLLLQPLVENAIVHGLRRSQDALGMHIRVSAAFRDQSLHIEVWDNGQGIPRERLEDIRRELGKYAQDGSRYFALVNVAGRLFNRYHELAGFEIDSREGKWTRVCIRIPRQEENDVQADDCR